MSFNLQNYLFDYVDWGDVGVDSGYWESSTATSGSSTFFFLVGVCLYPGSHSDSQLYAVHDENGKS